jgi:hypothetical protein
MGVYEDEEIEEEEEADWDRGELESWKDKVGGETDADMHRQNHIRD